MADSLDGIDQVVVIPALAERDRLFHTLYIAARGWMIPVGLIDALPDWTRGIVFEQTVWQWGLLVVVLLLAGLLSWLAVRWSRRVRPEGVRSPCLMMPSPSGVRT